MKHLLNGVAIAAALAITAPAWAQTSAPMTPAAPPAASSAAPAPMATTKHHRARPHRMARHGRMAKSSSDSTTDQLNRQELSRIQTGGGPAPMAPAPMPGGQIGPRPSGH